VTLTRARHGFHTKLLREVRDGQPAPEPWDERFRLVHYPGPLGAMAAYLASGGLGCAPALLWLPGEFARGLDGHQAPAAALAFLKAGFTLMIPSVRGGNDNPGCVESFLGEVDDVLTAAAFLAAQPGVDPDEVYLGGHSTGATLALLAAASSTRFRGVFAFGPTDEVGHYPHDHLTFDFTDARESELRSPIHWLGAITSPTLVFEGDHKSNRHQFERLASAPHAPCVEFHLIENADHFSGVAPMARELARRIGRHETLAS
jgi:alpha-beta hydrolase superfamily lysophospholipase